MKPETELLSQAEQSNVPEGKQDLWKQRGDAVKSSNQN